MPFDWWGRQEVKELSSQRALRSIHPCPGGLVDICRTVLMTKMQWDIHPNDCYLVGKLIPNSVFVASSKLFLELVLPYCLQGQLLLLPFSLAHTPTPGCYFMILNSFKFQMVIHGKISYFINTLHQIYYCLTQSCTFKCSSQCQEGSQNI